jgi:alpha-L-arabinofuranosidase
MQPLRCLDRFLRLAAFAALAVTAPKLHAELTHTVYADTLVNDWQDWGWAQINYSHAATVRSGTHAIAVTANAWEAVQIGRGSPFDTTGYTTLRFWVHGGAGGQMLNVVAALNYVGQPGVGIGPLPANTWQLVEIPLTSLSADNRPNLTNFFIQNATPNPAPTFYVDDIDFVGSDQPTTPPPPLNGGMAIYQDALVNGWQNWSWSTVVGTTAAQVHTGTSAMAVTISAWGGLSLYHPPLDTANYPTLTFWINGGSVGGQVLRLLTELSGVAQTGIELPPLAANTWTKFVVSLADLQAANRPDLTRITLQNISGSNLPTFYLDDMRLDLAPPPAVVKVNVNSKETLRTVDHRLFGLNAAIWDWHFETATTAELLLELDNRALRFPGGSISDIYHWATNTTENNTWEWGTSFDEFAHIAKVTGAEVFITVNYGTGTPEEAAAWVRYSNVTKRYGFKYWEVGNENYGSWEADINDRPHDPVTYATRFKTYMAQMKAQDPTIKVGAVVQANEDSDANYLDQTVINPRTGQPHDGWTAVLLATFKKLGVIPDFVVYHRYEQAPGQESDAFLLQSSKGWAADAASIRQMLTDYLGAAGARVEINCTEGNSVYSNPGKQTTSLVNGLFLADSLGNIMKTEFNAHFWWDFRNGTETGNNNSSMLYGWRPYGDYGIVNNADPAGPADRYPTFYVYKLLQHFARGGELVLEASSSYNQLGVYAVRDRNKTLHLLLINKHPTATLNAEVDIDGFNANPRADVYTYGIPQDEAARTGEGSADITHTTMTLGGKSFTFTPAPYSVTVIRIKGNQGKNDTAPNNKQ